MPLYEPACWFNKSYSESSQGPSLDLRGIQKTKKKTAEAHSGFFLPLLKRNPILAAYWNKVQKSVRRTYCSPRGACGGYIPTLQRTTLYQSWGTLTHSHQTHSVTLPSVPFFCWDRWPDSSHFLEIPHFDCLREVCWSGQENWYFPSAFHVFVKTFPDKRAAVEIICCP